MLDRKKEDLRHIQMNQLPAAMTEIGLSNFSLSNGASLIVKPFYSCSCTDKEPELKERGLKWLRKEYPSVVKHEVKVTLGVDAVTELKSIRGFLNKKSIPFKDGQGVHNGTLKALMRECVEAGKPFPLDLFRGFIGKITEITMPK